MSMGPPPRGPFEALASFKSPSWDIAPSHPLVPAAAGWRFVMPVSVIVLLVVFAVSAVGTALVVRRERRRPSSYRSRWAAEMAEWRALPTEVQAAYDTAVLDAAEAAESAAARAAGLSRS